MRCERGAIHAIPSTFGVPDDWQEASLGELTEISGGATPDRSVSRFWNGDIPWATPTDLTDLPTKYIAATAERITHAGLENCSTRLLPAGTLLFTSRATIGAIAIAGVRICTNQGFANFEPKLIDGDFLFHLLRFAVPTITRLGAGTTFLEVNKRDLRRLRVAIPKVSPEQKAIAAILDAADIAIERTREACEQVLKLRKAIVQRFLREALGPISSADRPGRKIKDGWRLLPTAELLAEEPKNGVSPPAESQPPGNPTFSIAAVRNGRVDLGNKEHLKYVRIEPRIATKYAVRDGDVLVVRGNANPDLVGKCGIVAHSPAGCIYPDILKRLVFSDREDGILPRYAALVWNHPLVHNQVLKRAKTSNGTLKINNRDVKQIILPLPSKHEQTELLGVIDAQERLAESLTRKVNALTRLKRGLMQDLLTGKVRVPAVAEAALGD